VDQFDAVAYEPRKGDKLKFSGGYLVYEVISGLNGGLDLSVVANRIAIRREHKDAPFVESRKAVPIHKDVWADLVARAATIERGPVES